MARPPKDFEIKQVLTHPHETSTRIQTSPGTAVPSRFTAAVTLKQPELTLSMEVLVDQAGTRPRLVDLRITSDIRGSITTSALRRVLVDQLLQAALDNVCKPSIDLSHVHPNAFRTASDPPDTAWVSPPPRPSGRGRATPDDLAREAAQIYAAAVTKGSRAPAVAVANDMRRSRAQAARYIRRARELHLLPLLDTSGHSAAADATTTNAGGQEQ